MTLKKSQSSGPEADTLILGLVECTRPTGSVNRTLGRGLLDLGPNARRVKLC